MILKHTKRTWAAGALFSGLVLPLYIILLGCGQKPAARPSASMPGILTVKDPIALKDSEFELILKPAIGINSKPSNVTIDLSMTTMFMPPNTVVMHQIKPNRFAGKGTFTMSGTWIAKASEKSNGKNISVGIYTVIVKDPQ